MKSVIKVIYFGIFTGFRLNLNAQLLCEKVFPEYGFKIDLPCDIKITSESPEELYMGIKKTGENGSELIVKMICLKKFMNTETEIEEQMKYYIEKDQFLLSVPGAKPNFTKYEVVKMYENPYKGYYSEGYAQYQDYEKIVSKYLLFIADSNYILLNFAHQRVFKVGFEINDITDSFEWLPKEITDKDLKIKYSVPRNITNIQKSASKDAVSILFTHKNLKSKLEIFKLKTTKQAFESSLKTDTKVIDLQFGTSTNTKNPDSRFNQFWSYKTKSNNDDFFVKLFTFDLNGQTFGARIWMEYSFLGTVATDVETDAMPILYSLK